MSQTAKVLSPKSLMSSESYVSGSSAISNESGAFNGAGIRATSTVLIAYLQRTEEDLVPEINLFTIRIEFGSHQLAAGEKKDDKPDHRVADCKCVQNKPLGAEDSHLTDSSGVLKLGKVFVAY